MEYEPRAGFMGAVKGVMARPMLRRLLGQLLTALESEARTGQAPMRPTTAVG